MHAMAVSTSATLARCLGGTVGLVLLCGSLAVGQQPTGTSGTAAKSKAADKPAAKSLEELLAVALKSNPDIRVGDAKVREAEAELNRTRLQTTQKVVTLHRGLEAQKALVESAEAEAQRYLQLERTGAVPAGSLETARQKALQAKARLTEIEAELAYLTGQQPAGVAGTSSADQAERHLYAAQVALAHRVLLVEEEAKQASQVPATIAGKLRKALDTPVKVDFQKKTPAEILKELQPKLEGVPIRIRLDLKSMARPATLQLAEPIPLGGVFQLLEDETGDLYFVLREYGIIVVLRDQPAMYPPDAEGLVDFWKGVQRRRAGRGDSSFPVSPPGAADRKNPPPDGIEGEVEKVDARSQYLTVNVGTNKGLAKDHTLEVYRLQPKPTYLGTIRILDVRAEQAVALPVGRPLGPIQQGDKVASKVQVK